MSAQIYTPYLCNITAVTAGQITTVTTDIDTAFVVGSLIAFSVPPQYGMRQLNGLKGYVITASANTLTVNIDSSSFDPFVVPTVPQFVVLDPAQVMPAGDANSGYLSPGGIPDPSLTIPGAYQPVVI